MVIRGWKMIKGSNCVCPDGWGICRDGGGSWTSVVGSR